MWHLSYTKFSVLCETKYFLDNAIFRYFPHSRDYQTVLEKHDAPISNIKDFFSILKLHPAHSFQMSVTIYQTTLCHIPEDRDLHGHRRQNVTSPKLQIIFFKCLLTQILILIIVTETSAVFKLMTRFQPEKSSALILRDFSIGEELSAFHKT